MREPVGLPQRYVRSSEGPQPNVVRGRMKAGAILRSLRTAHRNDCRAVLVLAAGYLATGLVPRRLDGWLVPRLLKSRLIVRRDSMGRMKERIRSVLGDFPLSRDLGDVARQCAVVGRENQWLRWRATHGDNLPVRTSVEALHVLESALQRGRGAVLWGFDFCDPLLVKVALARAGQHLVHLSTPEHGTSSPSSEFGRAVVSPLYCLPENRFIDERVMIPLDGSLGYMRTLMDRLKNNRCVYIAGERRARRAITRASVFGRSASFARGAPGLAQRMGSPLLPIYVVRDGPLHYRAVIDGEIGADRELEKERFIDQAVAEFARRLESHVVAHPAEWGWWSSHVAAELSVLDENREPRAS